MRFLTDEEIIEFTGAARASDQARWLDENHIKYFTNRRGKVKVTDTAVENAQQITAGAGTPNFGALRRAG